MPEDSYLSHATEAQIEESRKEMDKIYGELQAYAKKANCIMCGKPAETVGLWLPDQMTRKMLNEPQGHARVVVYGMCLDCLATKPQDEVLKAAEASAFQIVQKDEKPQS